MLREIDGIRLAPDFRGVYTALNFLPGINNESAQFRGRNSFMKDLTKRFAMLAVLGSLIGGMMVAGCGGDDTETTTTTETKKTEKDGGDED